MRGSPANRVPLDHDEAIEGFSATVVWRGSFCDEAAGDQLDNLHSRPQKLRTVQPRKPLRIRRRSCSEDGEGMPLLLCRWSNGDCSMVWARHQEDAIVELDQVANPEGCPIT